MVGLNLFLLYLSHLTFVILSVLFKTFCCLNYVYFNIPFPFFYMLPSYHFLMLSHWPRLALILYIKIFFYYKYVQIYSKDNQNNQPDIPKKNPNKTPNPSTITNTLPILFNTPLLNLISLWLFLGTLQARYHFISSVALSVCISVGTLYYKVEKQHNYCI